MFNLKVSPATAEALFGRMPACSEFLVACDPTEPLHSDAPVGARHFNGAFVVGYVRTGEPNTADKVCVEVIGEGHALVSTVKRDQNRWRQQCQCQWPRDCGLNKAGPVGVASTKQGLDV